MNGFHVLLDRRTPPATPTRAASLYGVLDLLVDGSNVTARIGEGQVFPFLRDLALATVEVASGKRPRTAVRFYQRDDAWELGVARVGGDLLLTVFRGGSEPEVAVFERRVPLADLVSGVLAAIDEALSHSLVSEALRADLACARDTLAAARPFVAMDPPAESTVDIEPDPEAPFALGACLSLRDGTAPSSPGVERADLHALLLRGRLRVALPSRTRDIENVHVFVLAERLALLARDLVAAWDQGLPYQRRAEAGGVTLALRLATDGELTLAMRGAAITSPMGESVRLADVPVFVEAVVAFGRSLSRALLRSDRSFASNLRLTSFRATVKALADDLRDDRVAPVINAAPESYRAYAVAAETQRDGTRGFSQGKLRFVQRWTATVPAIDLRGTFLCGDRLVIGAARETTCLDRASGAVLWQRPTARAISVPTPGGLARIHSDGLVDVLDFGTGEVAFSVRVAARQGTPATGAVVHAPALPKLLVVTEGEKSLSAIDLVSGEVRWRRPLSGAGTVRIRRAGKLLVEVSGDASMTGIDVQSGETVWKFCDKLPFPTAPCFDQDSLYLVGSDNRSQGRIRSLLHAVDAWTGAARFSTELARGQRPLGGVITAGSVAVVVTRDERGAGLSAFDRATGEARWSIPPGFAPPQTAWIGVDDAVVGNTEDGDIVSVDASTGEIRFRRTLARSADDALPRSLEPVLRSGALFVPQGQVHVLRPRDGELLGIVPTDLVPDLLRVDERCDVFVAEESGHVAAFGAGPQLSIVKK